MKIEEKNNCGLRSCLEPRYDALPIIGADLVCHQPLHDVCMVKFNARSTDV
jgi:hypothetical protein